MMRPHTPVMLLFQMLQELLMLKRHSSLNSPSVQALATGGVDYFYLGFTEALGTDL